MAKITSVFFNFNVQISENRVQICENDPMMVLNVLKKKDLMTSSQFFCLALKRRFQLTTRFSQKIVTLCMMQHVHM